MIDILVFVFGIIIGLFFALGVFGVLVKKKNGKTWIGQGFGRK